MTAIAQALRVAAAPWRPYVELTKPRLSSLVLFTTLAGFAAGADGAMDRVLLIHALIGTALVAGGANALNQVAERQRDALMHRTQNRPLPSGRLGVSEATRFGIGISAIGLVQLLWGVNLLTASLGAAALIGYVFVYTPLKTVTVHNTLVGAVVGALPPMMGWTAVTGTLSQRAWLLFAILFVWQLPHFFSIAWIYREDYRRGGYRMLSVADETGWLTRLQVPMLAGLLVPLSLLPVVLGQVERLYGPVALALGVGFFACCLWGPQARERRGARRSFIASIVYLPILLAALLWFKL